MNRITYEGEYFGAQSAQKGGNLVEIWWKIMARLGQRAVGDCLLGELSPVSLSLINKKMGVMKLG